MLAAGYVHLKPGVHQSADLWLLLATLLLTACYADLHQNGDLWLLLASFVITACYTDLKPGVHQNSDLWLLLATFVITTCYADLKPGVRILAAAGTLRPQDLKITGPKGRRHRTLALKRRGGMGAAL